MFLGGMAKPGVITPPSFNWPRNSLIDQCEQAGGGLHLWPQHIL